MDFILRPDNITNGTITRLIENVFLAEDKGEEYNVSSKELAEIYKALIKYDNGDTFGEIAMEINYPPKEFEDVGENLNFKENDMDKLEDKSILKERELLMQMQVKLYDKPGFILYDGIYAKAGGRFGYLYRGRGNRIIWFADGEIKIISLILEIDSDGLNYNYIDEYSFNIFNEESSQEGYCNICAYAGHEEFPIVDFRYSDYSDVYFWIEKLTNINMQFERSYALEYLIHPADVQRRSKFSIRLRCELWESCLNLAERIITGNVDKKHLDLFKFYVNFLEMIKVEPDINQVNSFFGNLFDNIDDINKMKLKNIINILIKENNDKQSIDITSLTESLDTIKSGREEAKKYHDYIFKVLKYVFNPYLRNGHIEQEVNNGRMRIDIVFDNISTGGFFQELSIIHKVKCPYIFIECKNYENDIANPELDQISGRLNEKRGLFGFLVCRYMKDEGKLIQRCKDIVNERKQYIIILCDNDIKKLIRFKKMGEQHKINDYLRNKLRQILF